MCFKNVRGHPRFETSPVSVVVVLVLVVVILVVVVLVVVPGGSAVVAVGVEEQVGLVHADLEIV